MNVCGIEIKGSEAIICLLTLEDDVFHLPECRARKLTFGKEGTAKALKAFQAEFAKLLEDYKFTNVVIKERPSKGKFAGGAAGFKIEAAIQLIDTLNVTLLSPTDKKAMLKRNPVHIPFIETGLKIFQQDAFETAFAFLMQQKYPSTED
ncbi:DUF3010 family protein [Agaribacter marinus]|uniref:DUF3010 domain-containing protein n=1 Tax=Agaribacter marinus TaxID=1431249 RepID=A0AA37SXI4_9ALTE|nr:DUF3010 family protein [Agaribacter marinus]GLR69506.1 hypothetical protein GCM10007852_04140 [Agaribacter marinus]